MNSFLGGGMSADDAELLNLARSRLQHEVLERREDPLVLRVVRSTSRPAACLLDVSIPGVFSAAIELHRQATRLPPRVSVQAPTIPSIFAGRILCGSQAGSPSVQATLPLPVQLSSLLRRRFCSAT